MGACMYQSGIEKTHFQLKTVPNINSSQGSKSSKGKIVLTKMFKKSHFWKGILICN